MKPKHTIHFTPTAGLWLGEYLEDGIYDQLLSLGGNRSSKQMILRKRLLTIEELAKEEFNPDFVDSIKHLTQ